MEQVRLAVVLQPAPEALRAALKCANNYTRKFYGRTSGNIRHISEHSTTFIVPHVTIREHATVPGKEVKEFVELVRKASGRYKPFQIDFDEIKSFDKGGKPFVWYWNVKLNSALSKMEQEMHSILKKWPANRYKPYNPHLTLVADRTRGSPTTKHAPSRLCQVKSDIKALVILRATCKDAPVKFMRAYKIFKL